MTDSYVKEALKTMLQCQPRLTEDLPMDQDGTNATILRCEHSGPMEPPVNSPEAGHSDVIETPNSESRNLENK